MELHSQIDTKRDLTGEIRTNAEPQQLKVVADNLINLIAEMLDRLDYSFPQYHTMTELDKLLMLEYWEKYDNLNLYINNLGEFEKWFMKRATEPEMIRRARQWLSAKHYIHINKDVKERADEAGINFGRGIKSR